MEHFAYLRLTILEYFIPTIIDIGAACLTSQAFKNLPSKYGEILILEHTKLLWANRFHLDDDTLWSKVTQRFQLSQQLSNWFGGCANIDPVSCMLVETGPGRMSWRIVLDPI